MKVVHVSELTAHVSKYLPDGFARVTDRREGRDEPISAGRAALSRGLTVRGI